MRNRLRQIVNFEHQEYNPELFIGVAVAIGVLVMVVLHVTGPAIR
ncbi:hypothetical protein [Aromatoleum evansii]|nr:hypothetical protein [Aromatoleum evansii]